MTDPIADMLTRIRNALLAKKEEVAIPFSKIKFSIAEILKKEGFISDLKVEEENGKSIVIILKYNKGNSVIQSLRKVSKPGRRIYVDHYELPHVLNDLGVAIVSTSSGVMTNKEAKKKRVGGEVICDVY